MRAQIEQFFKQRKGLAIVILLLSVSMLVFVMPKIFFSLEPRAKGLFCGCFLLSLGIFMFLFDSRRKKDDSPIEKTQSLPISRSYQQLLDEAAHSSQELKKQQRWAYGCLIMGWIVLWIGKWSEHPPYNHPIFAIPVFVLAFLAATRSWEKENELDVNITKCTLAGIEMEKKRPEHKSNYFHDLAKSYEGSGMWQFAFIRVSPALMILASLLNAGPLSLLANHFSIPSWVINCGAGVILGAAFLFFSRIACQPYYWLLEKKKAIAA